MFLLHLILLTILISAQPYGCIETFDKPPHIVLIVADDLGWNDVAFHGSNQITTPNIDALAYNGVSMHRFYTHPACTPSRAALLTGLYSIRTGLQGYPVISGQNRFLPKEIEILPQKLKNLGYVTHLVGKWHLGASYRNITPTERGFDSHCGYWHGLIGYFDHQAFGEKLNSVGLDMHDGFTPVFSSQNQYATTLFTEKAQDIISEHDTNKPLFLMISHLAGHSGEKGKPLSVPNPRYNNIKYSYIEDEGRRLFAGVVKYLDDSVGATIKALADKGILNETFVIFISDNGAPSMGMHKNWGSNWPLRGTKLTVLEGGVRNTAIFYHSKFKYKKIINKGLMHISDIMPTIYAAAGGDLDDLGSVDGINQWDTLLNGKKSKRTEILLEIDELYNESGYLGLNGRFKLVNGSYSNDGYDVYSEESGRDSFNPVYNKQDVLQSPVNIALGNQLTEGLIQQMRREHDLGNCRPGIQSVPKCEVNNLCLFDLLNDPCETTNVAQKYPNVVAQLKDKLSYYRKQLVPQARVPEDPRADPKNYNFVWYPWMDDY